MEKLPAQLDAHIDVITPENIAFHYEAAGPFRRLPAYLIDLGIRVLVGGAVFVLAGIFLGFLGMGIAMTAFFILAFFYGGLFEALWNGQTPGKRMMNLRVLTIDGQPINAMQAVMRNLVRFADAMPIPFFGADVIGWIGCYLFGLVATASNRRYQRLGDLVCGTMVVIEHPSWLTGVTRVNEPRAVALAELLPKNFEVSRELGQALSAYVERRRYFSIGRRADIARYVGRPLIARFGLAADTSCDLLLCALYHQTFFADEPQEDKPPVLREPDAVLQE